MYPIEPTIVTLFEMRMRWDDSVGHPSENQRDRRLWLDLGLGCCCLMAGASSDELSEATWSIKGLELKFDPGIIRVTH